jgi:hypothetical protein
MPPTPDRLTIEAPSVKREREEAERVATENTAAEFAAARPPEAANEEPISSFAELQSLEDGLGELEKAFETSLEIYNGADGEQAEAAGYDLFESGGLLDKMVKNLNKQKANLEKQAREASDRSVAEGYDEDVLDRDEKIAKLMKLKIEDAAA